MKLKKLLDGVSVLGSTVDMELDITGVSYDTRKAMAPGCLFVALTGFAFDGNRYIPMALEKGAAAIVTAKKPQEDILHQWS